MKKKATLLLALIMAGILTAGVLAGCGENSDNNGSDGEYSLQEDSSQSSTETPADNAGNSEEEEKQSADNEPKDDSGAVFNESSEQSEVVYVDNADINEEIDNKALATWIATTKTPDTFEVYIWDAESETAIQVENQESYTITEMDELVIRCGQRFAPNLIGEKLEYPYVIDLEYFIYKLDDIESNTYVSITMVELTEDFEMKDTDYTIEFILLP